jgi:N-acetyl-anhydromuramyl-L-alanine amidase AmpD
MTPRPEVRHIVRNQSSRNGTKPLLIVLHSTESLNQPGLSDLRGIGDWFDNPKAQASSHTCNDAQGNDARYVPDNRKAWSCVGYNSLSLNHEQIGAAAQSEWPEAQLRNTAEWIAYWSKLHGIPIQRGRVANGQVVKPGIVMHSELGAIGGGHHDPGAGYPIDKVIAYALELFPDLRKQKVWKAHLTTARAMLKSLLAIRARMRQNHLESGYAPTTQQLNALRKTITTLKRLIGGKS